MIALPLFYATRSRATAFAYAAVLGGLSQPLGALLGLLAIRNVDKAKEDKLFGITFGIISGMMSLITIQVIMCYLSNYSFLTICLSELTSPGYQG